MRTIQIYRNTLHEKQLLADESGTTDYLGAIIAAMYPNENIIGLKFPSQLKKLIYPFTIQLRRVYIDTPISIAIIQKSQLPPRDAEPAIQELMAQFHYNLEFLG